ncbi:MAG: hypothetical protein ACRDN0_25335 [Trebonia sp.]
MAGTSDEQPEEAGRRQMNIQVSGELVTVVASDPLIVEAGKNALLALATQGEGGGESGGESGGKNALLSLATQGESGGESAAPSGVIRGADLKGAAAASLGTAWQALHDSLDAIKNSASAAQSAAQSADQPADRPGKTENPGKADNPGKAENLRETGTQDNPEAGIA